MSGIAGIVHFDGRPVSAGDLKRMTDVARHRGPDGIRHWTNGAAGLAHSMLRTTREAARERQPLTDETGRFTLVFDGRVDNREDLVAVLSVDGFTPRDATDAELVLQAFRRWDHETPARLLGDFAFAIWDSHERQLSCARDVIGMKPLYYYVDADRFVFASELHQVLAAPAIPRRPNEGMVAEYLAGRITSRSETLFLDVLRLPPAHALTINASRLRASRYWEIDPSYTVRHQCDSDYADRLRGLLSQAVRCRLRSSGGTAADLSGGLDSSSLVCLARSRAGNGTIGTGGFEAFSLVFPGQECDESAYIDEVVTWCGVPCNRYHATLVDPETCANQVRMYRDIPDYPNGFMSHSYARLGLENRFRVLVSGVGGDELLTGSPHAYADMLRSLNLRALGEHAKREGYVRWLTPVRSNPFLRFGVFPLVPPSARNLYYGLRNGVSHSYPWISRQLVKRVDLAERTKTELDWRRFGSFSRADRHQWFIDGYLTHAVEMEQRTAARFHYDVRYPYLDRRVVEYCLGLPEEQVCRGGEHKHVLRQALKRILPESVRQRQTKVEFSHVFVSALKAIGRESFENLAIAKNGWVSGTNAARIYREAIDGNGKAGSNYLPHLGPLWYIYVIELWFTTVFGSDACGTAGTGLNGPLKGKRINHGQR